MSRTTGTKACHACRTAKRKCGKQTPQCLRCRRRGIDCVYPPPKPSCFVLCDEFDASPTTGNSIFPSEQVLLPSASAHFPGSAGFQIPESGHCIPSLEGFDLPGISYVTTTDDLHTGAQLELSWSTPPESLRAELFPPPSQVSVRTVDLKRHVLRIHRWLRQWTETGSNPFIHPHLYRFRFPKCVQDAYMTLSCYMRKTTSNEQTVSRIIEDRAKQLVNEQGMSRAESSLGHVDLVTPRPLDSLEHLARVQALLVYQFLGLYDGDIRMRYRAETCMPILDSWIQQMHDHATNPAYLGGSIVSPTYEHLPVLTSAISNVTQCDDILWYTWILAESVRRTRIVAFGIQAIYRILQQDGPMPCHGNVMFTPRAGLWDAPSALAWEQRCSEVDGALMRTADTQKLLELGPDDVDDFAMLVMEINYGVEKMERWGARVEG